MKKKLLKGFLSLFFLNLLFLHSCRTDEIVAKQDNISTEKIGAFVNYENLLTKEKTTSRGSDSVSENYGVPFSILLSNYMDKHPEYASEFQKLLGDIDLGICSQTYGNSDKTVVFPVLNNGFVTNILACNVNLERDYVKFRMLDATNSEVINAMNIFQSRIKRAHQAREIEIEPIELQWTGGSSDFPFSWIFTTGGGGTSGGMDGGSGVHGLGGGGGGGNLPTSNPCDKAKTNNTAAKAKLADTQISAQKIKLTATVTTDAAEKSFNFGIDANGKSQTSDIQIGINGSSAPMPATNPNFTVIGGAHTHTSQVYNVASSGDIYQFYKNNLANSSYQYYYTFSQGNNNYVYTITNPTAFTTFFNNYPDTASNFDTTTNTWSATSPIGIAYNAIKDSFSNSGKSDDDIMDMVMAAMIGKFDMGISLSKADANGDFQNIFVKETKDPNNPSKITYEKTTDCNLK